MVDLETQILLKISSREMLTFFSQLNNQTKWRLYKWQGLWFDKHLICMSIAKYVDLSTILTATSLIEV